MSIPCALFTSCSASVTAGEVVRRKYVYQNSSWNHHIINEYLKAVHSLLFPFNIFTRELQQQLNCCCY